MPSPSPSNSDAAFRSSKSDVQVDVGVASSQEKQPRKGFRFWMVFVAICVSLFISALEFTAVSTALPTIINELHGEDFVWVASAYALASTALLPASGGVAEIFGRRVTMLGSLGLFALGSALCGAARNMNWLIAARTVQGAGGGGLLSLSSIILSDLVPLKERAMYNGLIGLTWACAAAMGPLVGGALASDGQWRWLFYLNLPLCGLAAVLVLVFLQLRTPQGSLREKVSRMDWIGNLLVTSSTTSCMIALTWGGIQFPWTSAHVLVPLILGLIGLGVFLIYEALFATEPLVPFTLLSNRTSLSGYIQNFINPVVMISVVYFMPTYYQACKNASPVHSGVLFLGLCLTIGPILIVTGASIQITKSYRTQLWIGWAFLMVAMGIMSTIHADSPTSRGVGYPALVGIGSGILYSATYFPVLAPLPVSENAHALAFFSFCRSFAAVWGSTIGSTVLQTQLSKRLPAEFLARFPGGISLAYSAIPVIESLEEPVRSEVREAFAQSIDVIWQVMIGIAAIGLLSCPFMKALPLHTQVDEKWGLENGNNDLEMRVSELPATK